MPLYSSSKQENVQKNPTKVDFWNVGSMNFWVPVMNFGVSLDEQSEQ